METLRHGVKFKGRTRMLDCGHRIDLIVENKIVLELKCVDVIHPIHRAQVLTYLKLSGYKLALLVNFNVPKVIEGIERILN